MSVFYTSNAFLYFYISLIEQETLHILTKVYWKYGGAK